MEHSYGYLTPDLFPNSYDLVNTGFFYRDKFLPFLPFIKVLSLYVNETKQTGKMKTVELFGNSDYQSRDFFLHKESNTFAIIYNPTCTADAESILANHLGIERNGLFNPKHLRPECKSHLAIILKHTTI